MRKEPNLERRIVGRPDAGKSLQDFLAAWLGVSRRAAKAVIDGRSVWVNRRCVWIAHHTLKSGDTVELAHAVMAAARRPVARREIAPADRKHVRVLAEFGDFLVVDKPAGLLSADDPHSVEAILREQLGDPAIQAVHRLDRDTTGCLLFARSEAAWQAAVEVFKTHLVQKQYRAIVVGRFAHPHVTVDAPLDGLPAVSHVTREAVGDIFRRSAIPWWATACSVSRARATRASCPCPARCSTPPRSSCPTPPRRARPSRRIRRSRPISAPR